MKFGEMIKEARLKKGYSQAELAELLGYKSRSSINKIEVGERDVPFSILYNLTKILDLSFVDLVFHSLNKALEDENVDENGSDSLKFLLSLSEDDRKKAFELAIEETPLEQYDLLLSYNMLNKTGKVKAIEYIIGLTKKEEYTKIE